MKQEVAKKAQCPQSPTGSHHWLIENGKGYSTQTCKHCGEVRKIRNWQGDDFTWDKFIKAVPR